MHLKISLIIHVINSCWTRLEKSYSGVSASEVVSHYDSALSRDVLHLPGLSGITLQREKKTGCVHLPLIFYIHRNP